MVDRHNRKRRKTSNIKKRSAKAFSLFIKTADHLIKKTDDMKNDLKNVVENNNVCASEE